MRLGRLLCLKIRLFLSAFNGQKPYICRINASLSQNPENWVFVKFYDTNEVLPYLGPNYHQNVIADLKLIYSKPDKRDFWSNFGHFCSCSKNASLDTIFSSNSKMVKMAKIWPKMTCLWSEINLFQVYIVFYS